MQTICAHNLTEERIMIKQQLLEKLQLINEMGRKVVPAADPSADSSGPRKKKKPKEWVKAEFHVKRALGRLGHTQCKSKGGCGHEVDAMVQGVGISIGHGDDFGAKDVGQGTLTFKDNGRGGRRWTHSASSGALQRHVETPQFTTAKVGGLRGDIKTITKNPSDLVSILHKQYGTKLKAPARPIKSGRELKHMNDEAYHIHKGGEMYLPIDGKIIGDHHREHHGSMYHVQHIIVDGNRQAHLYRTTKDNPLNILDKNGNPPPIVGDGLDVQLRVRAKDSNRQPVTNLYNRRAVTAIKVFGKVKDTPSTIDMLRSHHTIHSSSGIFTTAVDRIKAKKYEI